MKTTIELTGFPEQVLQRAVDAGIARSKTDAIRLGVLSLNREYCLMDDAELDELAVKKMLWMERENKRLGRKPESLEDFLRKYPHLKNVK